MPKLVVGPINRGLRTDREPFVIDNDSFPSLINSYQWRGRVKRKRGTSKLNRLLRSINTSTIQTDGAGNFNGNLLTGLETNASLALTQITIGADIFTDTTPVPTGVLTGSTGGTGTINYSTGALTIAGGPVATNIQFNYYPGLPVMGLEDLVLTDSQFATNIAFDTKYAYNISALFPYTIYDVSWFKNPTTGTFLGYVEKTATTSTPLTWNGQDYQQFWTINYQGAFWATNGTQVPFSPTNVGMPFKAITGVTIDAAGPPALATLTIVAHGLVQGDFVFVNEVVGITGINWQTGYVVSANPQAANTVQVEFPNATLGGAYSNGGIAQYLTNRSSTSLDCIRWYDGDPTTGLLPPVLNPGKGWVNFCPPLSQLSYSIAESPLDVYYLVGARLMLPFKDRLIFFGPVIESSSGRKIYLQDTVIYSQNGTPYYTVSYTNSPNAAVDTPTSPTNVYTPILVPVNQTATPSSWFEDSTGFGGFISVGVSQPIITVSANEDVLMVELEEIVTRMVYTGNDITPFNFFLTNSEYGCGSTFSVINMDEGVLSRGKRGFIIANQAQVQRFDLDILDAVFEINLETNGSERVTAIRDFINEWIYFTYSADSVSWKFPNQTLFYNYRDKSWGVFNEAYTTYGSFRPRTGFTWATVGNIYPTWLAWNDPWNSGGSSLFEQKVIAGNQQGWVVVREDTVTSETPSLYIQSISTNTLTVPDHTLNEGDYITISDAIGTVGALINGKIFSIENATTNTFTLNPPIQGTGTYLGLGVITRLYVPFIQTKQFPEAWDIARKTRIGVQQYLLTKTTTGQITVQIYLSQDSDSPYNDGFLVPVTNPTPVNNSLVYSQTVYTCPESTNLGLTPMNTNLNMLVKPGATAGAVATSGSRQIWHRMNTSLIGDTIQLGFTLSDDQMRDNTLRHNQAEVELHGFTIDVSPSGVLS